MSLDMRPSGGALAERTGTCLDYSLTFLLI